MFGWPLLDPLIRFALAAPVAWLVGRAVSRGLYWLWASGLDPRRRLAHVVPPLRLLLGVVVLAITLSPLEPAESTSAVALLAALLLVLGLIAVHELRDAAAGLTLSLRRPFTLGDQVATPTLTGRVVALGLTRTRLRTPDDALVDVPNRALVTSEVRVGRGRRHALPVTLDVAVEGAGDPVPLLAALSDQVHLSAYVDVTAPILVELLDRHRVRVHATPVHPDDADELRSDIAMRAWRVAAGDPDAAFIRPTG